VAAADAAELWFEVGMAYDAKHADDQAIDALGRAIAAAPDDARAKLSRGELYVRRGDLASARRDLEDVMRSPDPRTASAKPWIATLLGQLAGAAERPSRDARWDCDHRGGALVCRPRSR